MTLPSSPNQISASQIKSEFGKKPNSDWKIGDYRKTITRGGVAWPVDNGIPTSGTIKFSDFHGKQHNIVIVLSGGQTNRDKILDDRTSIDSTGYRGHKSSIRKVSKNIVYIIRTIGSEKGTARNKCALQTGTKQKWFGGNPNGGKILIKLGSGGKLYGAGGDGGQGGHEEQDGFDGQNGTSALGLEVNVESIELIGNNTRIQAGGGGGAGGGGAREDSGGNVRRAGGGGGGGGAGLPAGDGGAKTDKDDNMDKGDKGEGGELNNGGAGGDGGENDDEAHGGGGGGGGAPGGNAGEGGTGGSGGDTNGFDGSTDTNNDDSGKGGNAGDGDDEDGEGESNGGNGGKGGYAITRDNGISSPTLLGETSNIKGRSGQFGVS